MQISPVLLEVFRNRFSSICEEMGVTLTRTAFSPNIKERKDLSCAVFDAEGQMVAQAAHIPVHLGSMPLSVQAAIRQEKMLKGDMVLLNDPFQGGTHLPDMTLVAPVYEENGDKPAFYVANRAHHSDVGGMSSGSMPLSTSLHQEGIIIPPTKIVRQGSRDPSLLRLILANVRTPAEREGDLSAQIMANTIGIRRMQELIKRHDPDTVRLYAQGLLDYSERLTRRAISAVPDGEYQFTDYLDGDGQASQMIPIRLSLQVQGEGARLDFSASSDQVEGSVNAVRSITLSAALYVFRCLAAQDIPTNSGCMRPVEVITRKGSLLDAEFPAAVAGGNVETSQRIVDVILGALSQALPEGVPAASQGSMNNVAMGGVDKGSGEPFSYYETLAGGMGASCQGEGESAVHSHMTNTLNTPVEALEHSYPLRVLCYGLRRESGGEGKFRGGDGLVREIEALSPCEVTVLSERRRTEPYGLRGGGSGTPGRNRLMRERGWQDMPDKFRASLQKGDSLRIETPGGGGWGSRD